MVFFNDPLPCDDAAERAVRMAVAMRDRVREPRRGWRRSGHDLALGHRHRAGLRDARPDRLRGPLRLRRHRQRHQPGRPAVRRRRARGRSWSPSACSLRTEHVAVGEEVGDVAAQGLQPLSATFTTSAHSTTTRMAS